MLLRQTSTIRYVSGIQTPIFRIINVSILLSTAGQCIDRNFPILRKSQIVCRTDKSHDRIEPYRNATLTE